MTTPDVTIQRLDGTQIDLLEPLWRALIDHLRETGSVVALVPHEQSWARRRVIYEELLADGESFALGAWRGERLVGYAVVHVAPPDAVWFTGSRYAELTSLCLAPAERGGGLGTALLDAAEAGYARARSRPVRDRRRRPERRCPPVLRAARLSRRLSPDARLDRRRSRGKRTATQASGEVRRSERRAASGAVVETPETAARGLD